METALRNRPAGGGRTPTGVNMLIYNVRQKKPHVLFHHVLFHTTHRQQTTSTRNRAMHALLNIFFERADQFVTLKKLP